MILLSASTESAYTVIETARNKNVLHKQICLLFFLKGYPFFDWICLLKFFIWSSINCRVFWDTLYLCLNFIEDKFYKCKMYLNIKTGILYKT